MPVFGYKCENGHREDAIVLPGEEPPSACSECGATLKRTYGGRVSVQLHGWGFSRTDAYISDARGPRRDFKQLKERAERITDE